MKTANFLRVMVLATALLAAACGDDNDTVVTNGGAPQPTGDNQGATTPGWFRISSRVFCPTVSDCKGKDGFVVEGDGLYRIKDRPRGFLTQSELLQVTGLANAVVDDGIDDELTCTAVRLQPSALREGRTTGIQVEADDAAEIVFAIDANNNSCYRDNQAAAQGLDTAMAAFINKYDTVGTTFCTDIFVYGLTVTVKNAQGQAVTDANVTISEGTYTEQLQAAGAPEPGTYIGAGERPGRYTLIVTAPGLASYTEENLVLLADDCHVTPQRRDINLQ